MKIDLKASSRSVSSYFKCVVHPKIHEYTFPLYSNSLDFFRAINKNVLMTILSTGYTHLCYVQVCAEADCSSCAELWPLFCNRYGLLSEVLNSIHITFAFYFHVPSSWPYIYDREAGRKFLLKLIWIAPSDWDITIVDCDCSKEVSSIGLLKLFLWWWISCPRTANSNSSWAPSAHLSWIGCNLGYSTRVKRNHQFGFRKYVIASVFMISGASSLPQQQHLLCKACSFLCADCVVLCVLETHRSADLTL